ncbi:endonuclease III domain-containing protein [Halocatena marina]|uniref:endonuclease III domain-containing protein n=1 Tax=Halocatena marina TaxID=2934937 RepID=UPI0020105160|nr:endonuclease III [Halocatena marina]
MTAEAIVDRLAGIYTTADFPVENIGQTNSQESASSSAGSDTAAQHNRDAFECLVRTILSQNTSDTASQPAHDALMDRYAEDEINSDLAGALAEAAQSTLAATISSAGLYNQKSKTIIRIATRVIDAYGSTQAFDEFVKEEPYHDVRETLLDMNGVGPKTADCVLLFAGGRTGVFPVDTHVHRIYRRLGIAPPDADHEDVRQVLERDVPDEKCGFGHTASIQFGRDYCTARSPACTGDTDCPLEDRCEQVGIRETEIVDPADTLESF